MYMYVLTRKGGGERRAEDIEEWEEGREEKRKGMKREREKRRVEREREEGGKEGGKEEKVLVDCKNGARGRPGPFII